MDIYFLIGVGGMVLILLAFFMNKINKWRNDDLVYDVVNFLGSMCLVIYALPTLSWPFIILDGVWAIVSLKSVISYLSDIKQKKSKAKKI